MAQFNLVFFDIYDESQENKFKINVALCILKIFMAIEMLKRVYFYIIGCFILLEMEIRSIEDRSMYVMTFEVVYCYLWYNYYRNTHSSGFSLSYFYYFLGLFFSLLNGIFALGSNFIICKICMLSMNLGFIFAQIYSVFWRIRENY